MVDGVGLCVLGAGRLASGGRTADEILVVYFPGLEAAQSPDGPAITLRLPEGSAQERDALLALARRSVDSLSSATGEAAAGPSVYIVVHPTVESYQRATGREWWTAGASRFADGRWTVDVIPLEPLMRDARLEATLRHELAHVVIDARLRGRPLWVREGLAMHFGGDDRVRLDGPCPSDAELRQARSHEAMASSYRRAAGCVARALSHGVDWRDIASEGASRIPPAEAGGLHDGAGARTDM